MADLESVQEERVFFPDLDAIRFIAFLLVFLQHGFFDGFHLLEGKSPVLDTLIGALFCNGATGVQIFFVLSGYLITYLLLTEIRRTGQMKLSHFYLRRTCRIWPLYYAVVLFGFVAYPILKHLMGIDSQLGSRPWYYFVFLSNFDLLNILSRCPGRDALNQNILWSVAIEEQFYILWPLLLAALPLRRAWVVPCSVLLLCWCFRYVHRLEDGMLYFHTFSVMGDLAIGGGAAYLIIFSARFKQFWLELGRPALVTLYGFVCLYYLFPPSFLQAPLGAVFARSLLDLCWASVILEQCFCRASFFKLRKLRFFSKWGTWTYGLYLLHPIAILAVDDVLRVSHQGPVSTFFTFLLRGLTAFALSLVLARYSFCTATLNIDPPRG